MKARRREVQTIMIFILTFSISPVLLLPTSPRPLSTRSSSNPCIGNQCFAIMDFLLEICAAGGPSFDVCILFCCCEFIWISLCVYKQSRDHYIPEWGKCMGWSGGREQKCLLIFFFRVRREKVLYNKYTCANKWGRVPSRVGYWVEDSFKNTDRVVWGS